MEADSTPITADEAATLIGVDRHPYGYWDAIARAAIVQPQLYTRSTNKSARDSLYIAGQHIGVRLEIRKTVRGLIVICKTEDRQ